MAQTEKQKFLREAVKNRPCDQSYDAAMYIAKIQWDMKRREEKADVIQLTKTFPAGLPGQIYV